MKKELLWMFLLTIIVINISSCISNEKKAEDLIKRELSKTLYDWDSYSPVETKVSEAKLTAINDSACRSMGFIIMVGREEVLKEVEAANEAMDHMQIWGAPTYYSSSYSDSQYHKYEQEAEEHLAKARKSALVVNKIALQLKDSIAALDEDKVVGWEVKHIFRCKTKGGYAAIGNYRFVVDYNIENILIEEDLDDEDIERLNDIIESVEKGTFEPFELDE